jgi:dihydroneopterin aldolase
MTQRRIDLLAIEQNAWVLAARDPRCVVVNSRTELDWAMKNGQISVWAPSKIVLDAVDGPSAQPADAVALAAWFAATFEAGEMMVIGADLPDNPGVPLVAVSADQETL